MGPDPETVNSATSMPGWIVSVIAGMFSGLLTGALSAFGSLAYFGGSAKATLREHERQLVALGDGGEIRATLQAHHHRLDQLETDVRYEVRAIRESIHGLRGDFHVNMQEQRKELLELLRQMRRNDTP